jgi:SAM-dependent methyltransferase
MKPYELPISRARALYAIPTAPPPNRALELCCAREPLFLEVAWRGESCTVCALDSATPAGAHKNLKHADYRQPLPFAPGSFDLVVMHKTLDDLALAARRAGTQFDALRFVTGIGDLLAPGGVLAGCAGNRSSPKRLARKARDAQAASDSPALLTLGACRKLLQNAGFTDVRLFSLLPNWQSPLRLVEAQHAIAKIAFRHELESRRQHVSALNFWVRRLAVELGLYPYLEESIFFWGYKPLC